MIGLAADGNHEDAVDVTATAPWPQSAAGASSKK